MQEVLSEDSVHSPDSSAGPLTVRLVRAVMIVRIQNSLSSGRTDSTCTDSYVHGQPVSTYYVHNTHTVHLMPIHTDQQPSTVSTHVWHQSCT